MVTIRSCEKFLSWFRDRKKKISSALLSFFFKKKKKRCYHINKSFSKKAWPKTQSQKALKTIQSFYKISHDFYFFSVATIQANVLVLGSFPFFKVFYK